MIKYIVLLKGIYSVIGGRDVTKKDLKTWNVRLQINHSITCGASIISPTSILTAAHCVRDFKPEKIFAIMNEIHFGNNKGQESTLKITNVIYHPNHVPHKPTRNDIAILKYETVNGQELNPEVYKNVFINIDANVTTETKLQFQGFGLMLPYIGQPAKTKQYLDVKVRDSNECHQRQIKEVDSQSHLCVNGDLFEGLCAGDSGGAVYTTSYKPNGEEINVLYGLSSKLFPCGTGIFEDTLTRISFFNDWIVSIDPSIKKKLVSYKTINKLLNNPVDVSYENEDSYYESYPNSNDPLTDDSNSTDDDDNNDNNDNDDDDDDDEQ